MNGGPQRGTRGFQLGRPGDAPVRRVAAPGVGGMSTAAVAGSGRRRVPSLAPTYVVLTLMAIFIQGMTQGAVKG